jgi:hypothetical protein
MLAALRETGFNDRQTIGGAWQRPNAEPLARTKWRSLTKRRSLFRNAKWDHARC